MTKVSKGNSNCHFNRYLIRLNLQQLKSAMETSEHIQYMRPDEIPAHSRWTDKQFFIDQNSYARINDLIRLYSESIYLFPDEETVQARVWEGGKIFKTSMIRINEIVFMHN